MSLGDELVYICKLLIPNKVTRVKPGTNDDKDLVQWRRANDNDE